jgi:hypothetical protein
MAEAQQAPRRLSNTEVKGKLYRMKDERRNNKRQFLKRYEKLKLEASSWTAHWRDIADHTLTRRMRLLYDSGRRNWGGKANSKIINGTGKRALRILASGMMSGISSPARPWFRLKLQVEDLMKVEAVREWLHSVETRMRSIFDGSNLYSVLGMTYRDIGAFGVAAMTIDEDDQDVIRCFSLPIGSYVIQNNHRGEVDTIYHERWMTVGQIAEQFGLENASEQLKARWMSNDIDEQVRILHVIEPNEKYDSTRLGSEGMRYRSVWLEFDGADVPGEPLFEDNGFNEFPAMVPRWDMTGDDTYGDCPGMDALGDIRAVQQLEKRKLQAIDKIVTPPMVAPEVLERKHKSQLAGDVTYVPNGVGAQKYEPAYLVDGRVVMLREEIEKHEQRILQAFYADLFLMLASMNQAQPITAREVDERHEEKMLQLGPVLERLHDELLTRIIDRTFEIMLRRGMVPEPPAELQGMDLKVEFISILAQAQKLLGTIAVERLVGFVGSTVAVFPEAADKIDIDATIDEYAGMLGVNPKLVREGVELQRIRDQKAQQAQMAAMAQMAKPAADAASAAANLSQADVNQPGTIDTLVGALTG